MEPQYKSKAWGDTLVTAIDVQVCETANNIKYF